MVHGSCAANEGARATVSRSPAKENGDRAPEVPFIDGRATAFSRASSRARVVRGETEISPSWRSGRGLAPPARLRTVLVHSLLRSCEQCLALLTTPSLSRLRRGGHTKRPHRLLRSGRS